MVKAVAINGSPRADKGYTAMIMIPFIEGMNDAGADVETFYAKNVKIEPCTGEMHCWYEKPGECYIQDDMQKVYPILKHAEILILATPVYIPLPGEMQNIMNRLCPLVIPELQTREGRTRARFRDDVKLRKVVLVATGAWYEKENLSTVERIALEFAEDASIEFAGAILRPHAFLMKQQGELTKDGAKILEMVRQAGRELVENGRIAKETLDLIARPLVGREELLQRYNRAVKS
ncbi:MAG: flavodoxin family protein [candidate division WOR-3 bacterium]|nr:MAG: flavodoxin family protein [candidate division WOR-3 bacterium]